MAEPTSTYSHRGHQRHRAESERKVNERWPGGLSAMLADYRGGRATHGMIEEATGNTYRAIRGILERHGVPIHDVHTASEIGHKLRPDWGRHISRTKKQQAFRHPEYVTRAATAKRIQTVRIDPSRHGNAHARMSNRERQFSEMLIAAGIRHEFNKPAAHYFLDFYLPDLAAGIEMQRASTRPDPTRDAAVIHALSLRGIIYAPTWYFRHGLEHELRKLVHLLPSIDFSALGDCRYLCKHPGRSHLTHAGLRFMRKWADETPKENQPTDPNPDRERDTPADSE